MLQFPENKFTFLVLICLNFISYSAYTQNTENSNTFSIGIAYTPDYDSYNPVSIHYYLPAKSLKELQFLLAADIKSNSHYFRADAGINWLLSENNRTRKFQIYPSTSICYTYRFDKSKSNLSYKRQETFLSLGLNTNVKVFRKLYNTGRTQLGWGPQWIHTGYYTPARSERYAFNIFYYAGFKLIINAQ
jgi:hypothetical protein